MAAGTRAPKRRQTSASTGSRPAPTPTVVYSGRTISWRHCLLGLLVGEIALLVISNVALIATNAAFGSSGNIDGGVVGVSTLLAVILGGWLAAKLAGRAGLYQGIVVAIGFIAVGAIYTLVQEVIDYRVVARHQQPPPDRPRPDEPRQSVQRRSARPVRWLSWRAPLGQTLTSGP